MESANLVHESAKRVRRAARRGRADALYELARRQLIGYGDVKRNEVAGFHTAMEAVEQGHTEAQLMVGYCLVHGVGTIPDGLAARTYFMDAARAGSAVAYYNMGCCDLVGIGMPRSRAAARIWFNAAAERGYDRAETALRVLDSLDYGEVTEHDALNAISFAA